MSFALPPTRTLARCHRTMEALDAMYRPPFKGSGLRLRDLAAKCVSRF